METLFRGVACAMLRVAFTGHVSLPLPVCFAYFEAEHLTDENIFLCTRPWRTMQRACNHPLFRFHGCTWKRRKIDAALITLSRKKKKRKERFNRHLITGDRGNQFLPRTKLLWIWYVRTYVRTCMETGKDHRVVGRVIFLPLLLITGLANKMMNLLFKISNIIID